MYDDKIDVKDFPSEQYDKGSIAVLLKLKEEISKKIGVAISYFKFLNEYGDIEATAKTGFRMLFGKDQDPALQVEAVKDVINSNKWSHIEIEARGKKFISLLKEGVFSPKEM